ncbi:MAG: hypothetical protein LQ352_004181 [Teloschistes flavicans]|nr:MAG: hypothetical protein LQ352_004181 [Teloschistes flavicans]
MTSTPEINKVKDVEDTKLLTSNEDTMTPNPRESRDNSSAAPCTTAEDIPLLELKKSKDVECAGLSATKEDTGIPKLKESEDTYRAPEKMTAPEMIGSEDTYCAPPPVRSENNKLSRAYESEDTCSIPAQTTSEDDRTAMANVREDTSGPHPMITNLEWPMYMETATAARQKADESSRRTTRFCSWGMVKLIWNKHLGKAARKDESIPILLRATIPPERSSEPDQQRRITALRSVYPETSYEEFLILATRALREQNPRRIPLLEGLVVPYLVIHDLRQDGFQERFRILDRANFNRSLASYWRMTMNKMLPLQIEVMLERSVPN